MQALQPTFAGKGADTSSYQCIKQNSELGSCVV